MTAITEEVYSGSDDEIKIVILDPSTSDANNPDGLPVPFATNGVTKITLFMGDISIDSGTGEIVYDDESITLKLGIALANEVKSRAREVIIKAYDPAHPNGQNIVHPKRPDSRLNLVIV